MIIVGLDIASTTGLAVYNTKKHRSQIKTGAIQINADKTMADESDEWRWAQMGRKIVKLRKMVDTTEGGKIDLVVIETCPALPFGQNGAGAFGLAKLFHGAITSHLTSMEIPWATIPSQSWHKAVFGDRRPPQIPKIIKGQPAMKKDRRTGLMVPEFLPPDWKKMAVDECERMNIELPASDAKGKKDAAEAAMIAQAWFKATPHGPEARAMMVKLLLSRNDKEAA